VQLRQVVEADIEFHGHNDTGCAVANAFAAYQAGATHIDTCVLGIGERNGITPLASFMARMHSLYPQTTFKYDLKALKPLDAFLAHILGLEIPFNQPLTGTAAFRHKAGIHTKAVLAKPETYEALRPEDFGLTRTIHTGHRLMGWHSLKDQAIQQGLALSDADLKTLTRRIKTLADTRPLEQGEMELLLLEANQRKEMAMPLMVQKEVGNDRNPY
jgi:homocitrate synthase